MVVSLLYHSTCDGLCTTCSSLLQEADDYDSTSNSFSRAKIQVNQVDDAPRSSGGSSQNDENKNGEKVDIHDWENGACFLSPSYLVPFMP